MYFVIVYLKFYVKTTRIGLNLLRIVRNILKSFIFFLRF